MAYQVVNYNPANGSNADLISVVEQQNKDLETLFSNQDAEREGYYGKFENTLKSQEKLPDLYKRLSDENDLGGISASMKTFKDQIYNVKGQLDRLDENITARTKGSFTTQAQRDRLAAAEGKDLQTTLGRLGTGLAPVADAYGSASKNVETLLGLNVSQMDRDLEPVKMRIAGLSEKFAREMTGFDSARQAQLTSILDKISRERTIADREWERVQELAREEREFQRQKSLIGLQLSAARTPVPTPAASGGAPGADYNSGYNSWVNMLTQAKNSGQTWGAAAKAIKARYGGKDIPTGSVADQAFHAVFGGGRDMGVVSNINKNIGWKY